MPTVRDLITDSRVHVVDGAMGTVLYGRGVFLNVCYDELNLRQPELVPRRIPAESLYPDRLVSGLQAQVATAPRARPVVRDQRGAAGHDRRLGVA